MSYDVKLPDIGEGVAEGEIVRWLVKAGDTVREDQPLVEVMTDKASVEIPSPRAGVIASLHAAEGQVVPVGTVIISIAVASEGAVPAPPPERRAHTPPRAPRRWPRSRPSLHRRRPRADASRRRPPCGRSPRSSAWRSRSSPAPAPAGASPPRT